MTSILGVGIQSSTYTFTGLATNVSADTTNSTSSAYDTTNAADTTGVNQLTSSPLGDLRSQIESSVTTALSGLDPSSSPEDIVKAVRDAIGQTLKANGIDPQQLAGLRGGRHHHLHLQAPDASPQANGAAVGSDPDGDGDNHGGESNSTATNAADTSQQGATLLAALQSSSDGGANSLLALLSPAAASGQTGSVDNSNPILAALSANTPGNSGNAFDLASLFARLFASFPNGSGVDLAG